MLSDIHSEWIKYCWFNASDVTLQAHRNSYKTTAILVVGCIWYLIFRPETRILILRKDYESAAAIIQEIEQHYDSEFLRAFYEEILSGEPWFNGEIKTNNWSKKSMTLSTKRRITKEGNIEPLGVGGSITGRHYEKVLADDIITIRDRISKAERENTKTFVKELKNIPTVDGTICITGTPWHRLDAFSILPTAKKYPAGSIKIQGFTEAKLAEYRSMLGASLYAANYELIHIADENRLFDDPVYCPWPENIQTIAYLDPAYSGKNNTALTIGGKHNDLIFVRGYTWRENIVDLYEKITEILIAWNVGTLHIETNADQGASVREMKKLWPSVSGYKESVNKHARIMDHVKKNWHLLRFAEDTGPEYINEILDYQEMQEPDDAVDSLAGLIRTLTKSFNFQGIGADGVNTARKTFDREMAKALATIKGARL